jgi:two-component system, OmpR family, phosphate regulon sensor histidine kinase PhoR
MPELTAAFVLLSQMFSTKNISPRQLAAIAALVIAVAVALGIYVFTQAWKTAGASFVVVFAGSFALITFLLERFINRKIKLIYKFIYQTKASKKEEVYYKYLLPQKSLEEVNEEVEQWAEANNAEIELLRRNEAFRKEFLQNLAHEFKTPIFAIQGYVDTLLNGALENPQVNRRFLENTARNVTRMVNLVSDLDEISKLETGEQLLYKEQFIIQDLIKDVFESLSIKMAEKNTRTSIKKGCESPLTVFADKEKIRQVLINLLENAAKYGKRDGETVASIYTLDNNRLLVEISDDGIGMEEEELPRIFERFYRTREGRSIDVSGSGLGLAICKHIVEAHGQTIHVRSKVDVGTTVGFTLDRVKSVKG